LTARKNSIRRNPALAQRIRELEAQNREMRELIEGLAGGGQVTLIRPEELSDTQAFNLGYRRGYSAAIVIHSEEVAHDLQEQVFPRADALRDLTNALAGGAVLASQTGLNHAGLRDVLRPFAERIARDLYERYRNLDQILAQQEQAMPPRIAAGVTQFHEALIMFATGRDNGEALADCEAIQRTIAGEIHATLAGLSMGRPISEPRAWLGQRIADGRRQGLTYRAAAEGAYRELIARERAHELLEVEEQALTELDARARGVFRDYDNLPDLVVTYCKGAAEDWRRKGDE